MKKNPNSTSDKPFFRKELFPVLFFGIVEVLLVEVALFQ
jgi:hypothetical protein